MRSKFKWIFTLLVAFTMQFSFAQEKTVTGTVSDAQGPLVGANVLVNGTKTGASTDFDGKFAIKAKSGDKLTVSFQGYTNQVIAVGAANNYNVKLAQGVDLEEVVISVAQGIRRVPKELPYGVDEVKSKELVQAAPINAVTALAGKVSGLNIATRNNGVNPTTGVVLRGFKSLSGNNQALIVIDNVIQASSALNNLNPNDIASIVVLKSTNATVLYGSEGSNGALIVTTKLGTNNQKLEVAFNTSYTVESVKYFPELQTTFGPGFNDIYDPIENTNWGPRFDGLPRRLGPILADGSFQTKLYAGVKDGRKNFFVDGVTSINGVTLSGGDEKSSFFLSAQRTDVTGVTPRDEYVKDNFRLNASRTAGKLKVTTNISFYNDKTDVVGRGGYQNRDIYWNILNTAASVNLPDYKDWRNNKFATPEGYYNDYYQNPYMLIDKNRNTSTQNRLLGNMKLDYKFTKDFSVYYSFAGTFLNQYNKNTREKIEYNPVTAPRRAASNTPASVATQSATSRRLNSDLVFKYDKKLSEVFDLKVNFGTSVSTITNTRVTIAAQNLLFPGLFDPSTRTGELSQGGEGIYDLGASGNRETEQRLFGYYIDGTVGINNYLFLSGNFRTDRSSTLSSEYFDYYGGGFSLDITRALPAIKGNILNSAKLTGAYSVTGNGVTPFVGYTNELYSVAGGFPYGGTAGYTTPTFSVDPTLRPETSTTKEAGMELSFFKDRIKLNGAYFISNAIDQFNSVGTSSASGAASFRTNSGEIENKGFEIDLNIVPVRTENFEWSIGGNVSKIQNEVIELANGVARQQVGLAAADVGIFAAVGSAYPALFGTAYTRDDAGRVVIGPDGNPLVSAELKNLGSTTPNLIVGLNTSIRYKQLTLTAVADYRTGHVYYNNLVDALEFTGSTQYSTTSGRQPFVFPNSSIETVPGSGIFTPNTNITTADGGYTFWTGTFQAIKENYVVDATTFKIREIALTYDLPSRFLDKTALSSVSVGFVARNVLMLRSAQNKYTDPEFTTDGQQVSGFGTQSQLPPTGSYGFKLDVKF